MQREEEVSNYRNENKKKNKEGSQNVNNMEMPLEFWHANRKSMEENRKSRKTLICLRKFSI